MASTSESSTPNPNRLSATPTAAESAPVELSAVVDELLNSLSNKFAGVSSEIFAKMDEMSRRLDNLEAAMEANAEGRDGNKSSAKS